MSTQNHQAKTLIQISGRVRSDMTERLPKANPGEDEERGNVFRFKAVTNNKKSTQRDEYHRNSLSPAKRTRRIAKDIPENHVGNADRKKKNNGCSSAEKEIEESAS